MPKKTVISGIEHGRAAFAYAKAEDGRKLGGTSSKEYKAYTKKIPMLIKTNGLGATLSFIKAKASKNAAYQLLYDQMAEWFSGRGNDLIELAKDGDLVEKVIELNSDAYRVVTKETLALFSWLRRFAEGLIEGEVEVND